MCLILFAYRIHPKYKLIMAANRDEFYKRPTAPAHFWEDEPNILAGRDLEKRGTWMGVTKTGSFAAVTNYRDPNEETEGKRSRGELVADFFKKTPECCSIFTNIS
ncbi:MAG TPA: NRDE family protein [Bacillus sp. (in: firmicutes)]|nr:NRDE family protein [Bacillus sp. (in: firmicutes)]